MGDFFNELSYNPRVREAVSLAIYMVIGGVLALYVRAIYRRFGISVSNRDAFSANFPIITIATTLIIFVVKSKLALSLGLVGALSIVRFRAAIKEPEEIIFLFFCIALGLALGAEYYELAISGVVVFTGFVLIRHWSAGRSKAPNLLLTVTGKEEEIYSGGGDQIESVLEAELGDYSVQRLEVEGGEVRLRVTVQPQDDKQITSVIACLRSALPGCSISYVNLENLL